MDFSTLGLLFAGGHVSSVYISTEILRHPYSTIVLITAIVAIMIGILTHLLTPLLKKQAITIIQKDLEDSKLGRDVLLFLAWLGLAYSVSAFITYRRFGILGWLGLVIVNMSITLLV
jgi:uncharacterized membrane protein